MLYTKEEPQTDTSTTAAADSSGTSGDSGGLSAGAIAGIAAGTAVAALAAAAGGWVLLRRRRQGSGARAVTPGTSETKGGLEAGDSEQSGGGAQSSPSYSATLASSAMRAELLQLHSVTTSSWGQPAAPGGACTADAWNQIRPTAISRPAAVSPFARRQAAMAAARTGPLPLGSSDSTSLSSNASDPGQPAWQQRALGDVLTELVQFRAAEDAGISLGLTTSTATASGGPATPSGPASSGSSAHSQALLTAALPVALQEWVISPDEIKIMHKPGGEAWVLGEGARCVVGRASGRGRVGGWVYCVCACLTAVSCCPAWTAQQG